MLSPPRCTISGNPPNRALTISSPIFSFITLAMPMMDVVGRAFTSTA